MQNKLSQTLTGYRFVYLSLFIILWLSISLYEQLVAQVISSNKNTFATPEEHPGNGLNQHDFFYAGEDITQNMYIVRNGKIEWSYRDTAKGKGEISDAVLMKNGNVLFAHQHGVTLINHDKKVFWKYETPKGCETHTAQMIGTDHVIFIRNGNTLINNRIT